MDSWFFGLDAWPIQDGSYLDFRAGQTAEFDVAFYMPEWDIASDAVAPGCQRLDECRYSIIAEVVATLDHHAWVIDCGINPFRRGPLPEGLAKGSWVAGEADLFLDPYGGVDDSLVRRWHVRRILRKRVERWRGERHWARKPWEVIEATNAWVDDAHPYAAAYILECELLRRMILQYIGRSLRLDAPLINSSAGSPRRAAPRPYAARFRAGRPDRLLLGEPEDADFRRTADRLRGGPDDSGRARRHVAGGGPLGGRRRS